MLQLAGHAQIEDDVIIGGNCQQYNNSPELENLAMIGGMSGVVKRRNSLWFIFW